MSGLAIRNGEWVVVCDGAKALVLENVGDNKFLNLKTLEVFEQANPATHEQGTDKPGRGSTSAQNPSRSSVGQTDWHDRAEETFLAKLGENLDAASRLLLGGGQGEVVDRGGAAARARHAAPGLYACAQERGSRRARQGLREAARPRDREAPDREGLTPVASLPWPSSSASANVPVTVRWIEFAVSAALTVRYALRNLVFTSVRRKSE